MASFCFGRKFRTTTTTYTVGDIIGELHLNIEMGRTFLDHINGIKLYSCASCETNLTNKSELISTRFTGATGKK